MEAMENLLTRRSVKKYSDTPVELGVLEEIVQAGQNAPSGRNLQPTAFVIVTNPSLRNDLSEMNADVFRKNNPAYAGDPFYGAPNVIVVLADPSSPTYLYDGSLAMGNLLNAAHALDLGACWIHRAKEVFASEKGQQLLKDWNLEGYEGIGFCIVGNADAEPAAANRKSRVLIR